LSIISECRCFQHENGISEYGKWYLGIEDKDKNISREIESKYNEHERKRLSNRKRKRDVGAGRRPFKLKLRERFMMLLVGVLQNVHYLYIIRISF
jgi:hypothetical protein